MQALSPRQQEVLSLAVRHYVDTMEPVGSMTLVRRFRLPASAATVRSAMGALEQHGLLTQPHPSAGRVPSQQGYRLYVDRLLPAPGAAAVQLQRDLASLSLQWPSFDDLLLHLGRRLTDLTGLLSLITRPHRPQRHLQLQALRLVPSGERLLVFLVHGATHTSSHNLRLPAGAEPQLTVLERWANDQLRACGGPLAWQQLPLELATSGRLLRQLVDSQEVAGVAPCRDAVASGLGKLLGQPDFSHTASLRSLVQLVEEEPERVLGPRTDAVWIGSEHPHAALAGCAVVQAAYRSGDGGVGHVALIGPMRMAYATAMAAVRSVASSLQRLLS
ncbi:MAG: HrcA family transcriptional regulator [Cyanobacteria bacterium J06638_7]